MLGIIGAMEEEVNEILALMKVEKEYQECNYHFYEGFLGKKEVVVVQGGIGKVNDAILATLLLKNFDIDHVINVGSAGGLDLKENVGDVIISEKVVHHEGITFVNPGSAMINRGSYGYGTYAIIDTEPFNVIFYDNQDHHICNQEVLNEGMQLLKEFKKLVKNIK